MKVEWTDGWPSSPGDYWVYLFWNNETKVRRLQVWCSGTMVVELKLGWDFLYKSQVKGQVWHAQRIEPTPEPPEVENGNQA